MSIKKQNKQKTFFLHKSAWSRVNIYTRVHAHKIKKMFVIENYMHTEHRHTKCMGCPEAAQHRLDQHMDSIYYLCMIMVSRNT